jgi:hypothetical protein
MSKQQCRWWAGLLLVSGLVWAFTAQPMEAQGVAWSQSIELYKAEGEIGHPLLLGDAAGRLHLLWNEYPGKEDDPTQRPVIYYMAREGGVWSKPIDVLTQEKNRMDKPRGLVDPYGRLHVVYGVGEPLAYSHTLDANPESARNWTQPIMISEPQQIAGNLALDAVNHLHIVYSVVGLPVQHQMSLDWGAHWSSRMGLSPYPPANQTTDEPLLAFDARGNWHLVWTQVPLPAGYPPLGSFYSRSVDSGQTWSDPIQIAPTDHMAVALLPGTNDQLYVLYIGRAEVGGRYFRWSTDNGASWSAPVQISAPSEGGGLSGGDLALDSAGIVHAIFGLESDHVIAHSQWDGRGWSQWINIASPVVSPEVPLNWQRMSIEITQGNHLSAVWKNPEVNSLWYVEGKAEALEEPTVSFLALPALALPTPAAEVAIAKPISAPTPALAPTHSQLDWADTKPFASGTSPAAALLISVFSSVVIVSVVVLWQLVAKRK